MTALLHAHSGIRYLVLLAGLVAVGWFGFAHATGRPAGKATRVLGSVFVGLLDLQIALGIALAATGRFYPAVWGHAIMAVLAAVAAHVLLVANRRREQPGNALPLAAVATAMVLAVGGMSAIGRGPLTMTVAAAATRDGLAPSRAMQMEAKAIFSSRCAACHGEGGRGDGPAAAAMNPRPADLSDPRRQTELSDEAIESIIVRGSAAVGRSPGMPPSSDLQGQPVLKALREHVRSLKRP